MPGPQRKKIKNVKLKAIDKLYYLIVCSRGPGSETIIVEEVEPGDHSIGQKEVDKAEKELKSQSVVEVDADTDEGPVLALTKKATLGDIFRWLVKWNTGNIDSMAEGWDDLVEKTNKVDDSTKGLITSLTKQREQIQDAFMSACLRAFIDIGAWTSCNSWRKLEDELMTLKQFNQFVKAVGLDYEQLAKWDCKVLQAALSTYSTEGRLIKRGW